jgi:hypothetical protein
LPISESLSSKHQSAVSSVCNTMKDKAGDSLCVCVCVRVRVSDGEVGGGGGLLGGVSASKAVCVYLNPSRGKMQLQNSLSYKNLNLL